MSTTGSKSVDHVAEPEVLRQRAARLADKLIATSVAQSANLSADEQHSFVEKSAKLLELKQKLETPPARRKIVLTALLVLGAILIIAIAVVPVGATRVYIEAQATEVGFTTTSPTLLGPVTAETMNASGLAHVEYPAANDRDWSDFERTEVTIETSTESKATGIALLPIGVLPATPPAKSAPGVRVRLAARPGLPAVRARVDGSVAPFTISLQGKVQVSGAEYVYDPGEAVKCTPAGERLILEAKPVLLGETVCIVCGPTDVRTLLLFEGEAMDEPAAAVHSQTAAPTSPKMKIPTLVQGKIYFTEVSQYVHEFRRFELLEVNILQGTIPAVFLDKSGRLSFELHATVDSAKLQIGTDQTRNLMPSILQWIAARHQLSLIVGAIVYVTGLAVAIARWMNVVS